MRIPGAFAASVLGGAVFERLCYSQGFSQDPEVAVAILELFHLLPYKASMYLETVQVNL